MATRPTNRPIIGWREWVGLPELGTPWVKAKIDTGARSSSLHAFDLRIVERDGESWARFSIHPWQRSDRDAVDAEARIVDHRLVRSSTGHRVERPVIRVPVALAGLTPVVDLTLARRDEMGFRMLIGREAIRHRFLVDAGRSYLGGRPPGEVIRANRRRHGPGSGSPSDGADRGDT